MMKVLVVDNHPLMLKFMDKMLKKDGHQVLTAEDGLSALDVLKTYRPDIMFIDRIMPNIDGEKLCKVIRSMPELKDIYLVICSAVVLEEEINYVDFGADACIAKGPFNNMTEHVHAILNALARDAATDYSGEILGLEGIYHREITKELMSSRKHSEIILDNMAEGILELTEGARIIYANPAAVSLTGIPEERLLASNFTDLFQGTQKKRIKDLLEIGRDEAQTITEQSPLGLNGKQFALNTLPVKDNGHTDIMVILNDVTIRKHTEKALRESEQKHRLLADNTLDCIWLMNLDYKFIYVNPSVSSMFGFLPEEWVGSLWPDHCPPENMEEIISIFRKELEKKETHIGMVFETVFYHKNGQKIDVEINGKLIFDDNGKSVGFQGATRDITERKRAEAALKVSNQALQASLKTLKLAQDQLVQAEKMAALGDLVAGVAHEINTPIGVGITAASFLEEEVKKYSEMYAAEDLKRSDFERYMDTASEASSIIHTNLRRAADLITSFKQVAVDQSSDERRKFNLKKIIDEVLLSLGPKYKRTRHTISVDCPEDLELTSYPGAFSQIITNFVMNSLNHGFDDIEKGKINLEMSSSEGKLLFNYKDNGKGMNAEDLKKIFDPFFTSKRGQGGSGLGMHIVYNLATQSLNGQIECSSSPGNGIGFLITIPL